MRRCVILLILFVLIFAGSARSQLSDYSSLTTEDYTLLTLPPLDTLLKYAHKNPAVKRVENQVDFQTWQLKETRRDWLSYVAVRANATYGIMGNYTSASDDYTPLMTRYSGVSQTSYLVGAYLTVPLDKLINIRAENRKQRARVEETQMEYEAALTEIRDEIVAAYFQAVSALNQMKIKIEAVAFSEAQNKVMENDFVSGRVQSEDLVIPRRHLYESLSELEQQKAELNISLIRLELLTSTKLIQKRSE